MTVASKSSSTPTKKKEDKRPKKVQKETKKASKIKIEEEEDVQNEGEETKKESTTVVKVKVEEDIVDDDDDSQPPPNETKTTTKTKRTSLSFDERLEECKVFLKEHGHCKIPTLYKQNKSLGIWTQEMRRNFKLKMTTGKPRRDITHEQIAKLDEIQFHWGFKPKAGAPQSDDMWETNFEEVKVYYEEHNTFDIPANVGYLAEWVCVQRDQKKRRDSKMKCNINKARIVKLDAIGFNWNGPRKLNA